MKKTLLVTAVVLALTGCAGMGEPSELDNTIASAEQEIAKTKKMGYLWRDTEKFLDTAKKLQAEGKTEEAMKNAKKALTEAKLGQQQSEGALLPKPYFPN